MTTLHRGDRSADRRLRQVQRLGRPRDMLALGDGDEDAELFESHGIQIMARTKL